MAAKQAILPHLTATQVSWRRMLVAVPWRNMAARVQREANGFVVLSVPLLRPWWQVPPITWVLKLGTERNIRLDEMGTMLWDLCDGTRSVEAVIEAFSARYALTFHEARLSVTGHLREIIQRGALLIEQEVPPSGHEKS